MNPATLYLQALSIIREGMRFVVGRPEKLRQQIAERTETWLSINLLAANQQGDYGRCSWMTLGVTLRFRE